MPSCRLPVSWRNRQAPPCLSAHRKLCKSIGWIVTVTSAPYTAEKAPKRRNLSFKRPPCALSVQQAPSCIDTLSATAGSCNKLQALAKYGWRSYGLMSPGRDAANPANTTRPPTAIAGGPPYCTLPILKPRTIRCSACHCLIRLTWRNRSRVSSSTPNISCK